VVIKTIIENLNKVVYPLYIIAYYDKKGFAYHMLVVMHLKLKPISLGLTQAKIKEWKRIKVGKLFNFLLKRLLFVISLFVKLKTLNHN
jgi:hypothetical protein